MRKYKCTLIFEPAIDPADEKKITTLTDKFMQGAGVKITSRTVEGKKHLAYPIRKLTEGVYVQLLLESERINVPSLQKQVKMMPELLRYLVIAEVD